MLKTVNIMDHNYDDVPEALRCMASVDDGLSVDAVVSARWVPNDYGVPGSPVWYDAEDLDVECFCINGEDMTPKGAEAKFGKDAVNVLWEMTMDAADNNEGWDE